MEERKKFIFISLPFQIKKNQHNEKDKTLKAWYKTHKIRYTSDDGEYYSYTD